jgi:hypothetical protein
VGRSRQRRPAYLPWAPPARALAALFVLLGSAASLAAQRSEPLYLSVTPETGELQIVIGDLFDEPGLTRALHSGLPLRIRIVAGLWKDGFFDSEKGRGEWRASVLFDPLEQRYRLATVSENAVELALDSLSAVRTALREAFSLPLRPPEPGRYYYLGQVEVETLSLSDLEELQRWLRGNLAPAVAGEERMENAVGRGVRRALVRMLGLPARRFRVRSPTFEVGPGGPS